MAACEFRGELKYRDGQKREFVVKTENNLKSILAGVQQMSADVSTVLTELVLQEKGSVKNGKGDVQEVDDEEEDDSDEEDDKKVQDKMKTSTSGPPAKRTKTLRA